MSNQNDGQQPPSGEPPKHISPSWQPGQTWQPGQSGQPIPPWQAGQPAPPWQNAQPGQPSPDAPRVPPPEQPGVPWQAQPPRPQDQPNAPWPTQPPNQPPNPWQTPPEPRKPYTPDIPPVSGANDWAYERPPEEVEDRSVMKVKDYFITTLLFSIPCVGWIIALVFAFGSSGPQNRKNLSRGWLITQLVWIGITIIFEILLATAGFSLLNTIRNMY